MSPTAILWDNDGVLVDTEIVYFDVTRRVLAEIEFELRQDVFVDLALRRGRSAFELIADRFSADEVEELRQRRNRIYTETIARGVRINTGVRECLDRLQPRMRMGVVTGSSRLHFETMHRTTDLLRYFEFCLTHDEYSRSKPHPEPYLTALERYDLDADECVVVEDSERGLQAAVAAGLRCIAIPNELTRQGDFSDAVVVLDGVSRLPEALDQLG